MYTGMYHSHLLVLLKCNNKNDVYQIPYHFRYARDILKLEHLSFFHSKLEEESKINENIKKNTGEFDPLYQYQLNEVESYFKKFKVINTKQLIMALFNHLT